MATKVRGIDEQFFYNLHVESEREVQGMVKEVGDYSSRLANHESYYDSKIWHS
jgi:hypothetical protein